MAFGPRSTGSAGWYPFKMPAGACRRQGGRIWVLAAFHARWSLLNLMVPFRFNRLQPHSESAVIFDHLLAQGDASWMQSISETGPKRACGWQRDSSGIIRAAFISWTKRKISRRGPPTSRRKSSTHLCKPLSLLTGQRNGGNSPRPDEAEKNE